MALELLKPKLLQWAEKACDVSMNQRHFPTTQDWPAPRIIAHRGAWQAPSVIENTLPAFTRARDLGADGIEFDVHFARDEVPVIHHDADLCRLHGVAKTIAELDHSRLATYAPNVPTLGQVLQIRDLHFMIEIKTSLNAGQLACLRESLKPFEAAKDFHLLVLHPELIREHPDLPAHSWMLVGDLQLRPWIRESIRRGLAGVAGHYLTMSRGRIKELHGHRMGCGVGFVPTRNLYHREWARGVDWVFTNSTDRLTLKENLRITSRESSKR